MKAKQGPIPSDVDAKEKLIVYVYEYLMRSGSERAAHAFLEDIRFSGKTIACEKEGPGFLANWWGVFWDLYCAAPDKRNTNQAEPTNEAVAFVQCSMRPVMSPHHQTSPPQPPQPYMQPGPRGQHPYGPPPPSHPGVPMRHGPPPSMNAGPPRMQMVQPLMPPHMMGGGPPMPHSHGGPPMHNGPHHGPPQQQMMGGAPSPRYAPHPGHMTPGTGGPEPGPSPGLVNRMTPNHVGSPHPQIGGGPPAGPSGPPPPPGGMHPGMPNHSPMSHPGPPPPPMQQRGGPGGGGSGGGNWQGGYGSPAEQCFMPGPPGMQGGQPNEFGNMMMNDGTSMMEMKPPPQGTNNNNSNSNTPANQQQDDYVMPGAYGQPSDQGGDAGQEIEKLKESLRDDTNNGDQSGFNMDFADPQGKW